MSGIAVALNEYAYWKPGNGFQVQLQETSLGMFG
jgi:hypothetical protein